MTRESVISADGLNTLRNPGGDQVLQPSSQQRRHRGRWSIRQRLFDINETTEAAVCRYHR